MPSPPHLLTLPREIRDHIYDHLTRQFKFDLTLKYSPKFYLTLKTQLENAPRLSVLLVCSQINEEYRQSSCFRRPSIVVDWSLFNYGFSRSVPYKRNGARSFDKLFPVLHNVTILVTCRPHLDYQWSKIERFCNRLGRKATNLSQIRIAFHNRLDIVRDQELETAKNIRSVIDEDEFLLNPRFTLSGLQMQQMAEGYQIESAWGVEWPDMCHRLNQLQCFVYAKHGTPKDWWHANDLLRQWPTVPYLESFLKTVPLYRLEQFKSNLLEIWDWEDRRGDQIWEWKKSIDVTNDALNPEDEECEHTHWFDESKGG